MTHMKGIAGGVIHKMPEDLRKALISTPAARVVWEDITPLARNEWICWVTSGKKRDEEYPHQERTLETQRRNAPALLLGGLCSSLKTTGIWYSDGMTKNLSQRDFFALYIVFVVLLISYGPALVRDKPTLSSHRLLC